MRACNLRLSDDSFPKTILQQRLDICPKDDKIYLSPLRKDNHAANCNKPFGHAFLLKINQPPGRESLYKSLESFLEIAAFNQTPRRWTRGVSPAEIVEHGHRKIREKERHANDGANLIT